MTQLEDYKRLLSEFIKKQAVMLGPSLVLAKAKKINEIELDGDYQVIQIHGDPTVALSKLTSTFEELSGHTTRIALNSLMERFPHLSNHE